MCYTNNMSDKEPIDFETELEKLKDKHTVEVFETIQRIYGKPVNIEYPILGKLCDDKKQAEVIIELLDGSKIAAYVPSSSCIDVQDKWEVCKLKICIKDGIARITGTDLWTKPSNVIKE